MNKITPLTAKEERELLKAAKPVITIFLAINNLQKEIAEKENNTKNKQIAPGEIEKLKNELKKKKKELEKMGEEKVAKGKKAIRFLLYYNQHLVEYLANGYYSGGRKVDREELKAEGTSSLIKAVEKFDLSSKNKFSTYAGY